MNVNFAGIEACAIMEKLNIIVGKINIFFVYKFPELEFEFLIYVLFSSLM